MTEAEVRAAVDYEEKSRIIKECLQDPDKRLRLNASMASTIRSEVHAHSLARRLLSVHPVAHGTCPVFYENENGPVVLVNLIQKEDRVLRCRAFRDSLREEEIVTTVRDIDFVVMRGRAIRPTSFSLSNVCTLRWPELNGNAYSIVERARQRLKVVLATDETKITLRALAWVCRRFGDWIWSRRAETCVEALRKAVARVGDENKPVILVSLKNLILVKGLKFADVTKETANDPVVSIRSLEVEGKEYPVYHHASIPDHLIYVVPSGEALGEMSIFFAPEVLDYDKPERLIKGWLCYQDQGVVFTNVNLTNTVYLGFRGLLDLVFGGSRKNNS